MVTPEPISTSSMVELVMKPMPPICTRSRINTCPTGLQYVAVSTTAMPARHTAEVAVNSASSGGVHAPEALATGKLSSPVPTTISPPKT